MVCSQLAPKMLGRYTNLSQASTAYSSRPLDSRSSTATAVITPLEDFRSTRYVNRAEEPSDPFGRDRSLKHASSVTPSTTAPSRASSQVLSPSDDPEPFGPYFSIPKRAEAKPILARRGTTKELIGKFESLSTTTSSLDGGKSMQLARTSSATPSQGPLEPVEEKKGKGRSPIRQSFRSFLSVFSKKSKTTRDASLHVADLLDSQNLQPTTPEACSTATHPTSPPPLPSKSPNLLQIPVRRETILSQHSGDACTTPLPLYSGKLLYLCRPVLPDGLPVWISCDVTLHHSHIIVTWLSALGNPSSSLVQLSGCGDVRSLSHDDLNPTEEGLLPDDPQSGEQRVFELLFEGRSREKFAASSVKERAGWVNAVW